MSKTDTQTAITSPSVDTDCSPAFFDRDGVTIFNGDCRVVLASLPSESVNCCVTSPPYWGLRDYGHPEQIGNENTPDEFVDAMVMVFREVRRVLRDDGTLWLNLGDTYNAFNAGAGPGGWKGQERRDGARPKLESGFGLRCKGLKEKDLIGVPWRVALALQADGWFLRQDIIWAKPNPMPESVQDRCTKSHEYLFLLAKSVRYHCDMRAIAEPVTDSTIDRVSQPNLDGQAGSDRVPGKTNGNMKAVVKKSGNKAKTWGNNETTDRGEGEGDVETHRGIPWEGTLRNKRSVWTVTTKPYKEAHFATFPPELIEPCIRAGCPDGGTVLDPFLGSGTTAAVAQRHGCRCIGIELNRDYAKIAAKRFRQRRLLTAS